MSRSRSDKPRPRRDAGDLTFFGNLFTSIAEEMGMTLMRTAYSPNIKERRDFSCALFTPDGDLVAQAAHIPVHLGAMPMSVKAALTAFPRMKRGDVVCLNDPFHGGTHLPDITLVSPVFLPRRRDAIGILATRAHHADVGGVTPGSLPLSSHIDEEGLRIPPTKLVRQGRVNESLMNRILSSSRTPAERKGDLRAQLAAHATGEKRLVESAMKYGAAHIQTEMHALLGYGERMMKALIRKIPDGTYTCADSLEGQVDRAVPARSSCIPIKLKLTIRGARATADFTGSSPQAPISLNAVEAITRSAVYYCFLCLHVSDSPLRTVGGGEPPVNAGCFRPVRVKAPRGTVVNARYPAAVAGGNVETSQRIVDVVFGALAKALPDIIPAAGQGTMNNLTLGNDDGSFAYYETIAGGMGASSRGDGADAVQVHMTNTLNTPAEALEFSSPLRVERYAIARGTGGKGKHRGGNGVVRDIRVFTEARGTILSERRESAPPGLAGGEAGSPGKNVLIRLGKKQPLPGKTVLDLKPGDVVSIRTPGGGGWGKPGPGTA